MHCAFSSIMYLFPPATLKKKLKKSQVMKQTGVCKTVEGMQRLSVRSLFILLWCSSRICLSVSPGLWNLLSNSSLFFRFEVTPLSHDLATLLSQKENLCYFSKLGKNFMNILYRSENEMRKGRLNHAIQKQCWLASSMSVVTEVATERHCVSVRHFGRNTRGLVCSCARTCAITCPELNSNADVQADSWNLDSKGVIYFAVRWWRWEAQNWLLYVARLKEFGFKTFWWQHYV